MKTLIALLLLLSPLFVSAREYVLPSGLKIDIKEPAVTWTFKTWVLPSGLHRVDLIPIAQASNIKTFQDDIIQWIKHYAKLYNISEDGMIKLAECESNLNPRAYNPQDISYKTGKPLDKDPERFGLYQFSKGTFKGDDIWDWQAQIDQTAKLLSRGEA